MIATRLIGPLMHDPTERRGRVLLPHPLDVNQRRLSLAEDHMLKSRDRQEAICLTQLVTHGDRSMTFTPAGGLQIATE